MKKRYIAPLFLLIAIIMSGCQNATIDPVADPAKTDGNQTKSTGADLSALTVSAGTLNPVFAAGTVNYTVSVPNTVTSIVVTGTKADSNATISANNGVAQNVNVGANTIAITVTAQDAKTTKTYSIIVTRAAANAPVTLSTADYLDTTPGKSIRYGITYPAAFTNSKPDHLSLTFQSINSTTTTKRFFCTTSDTRESSYSLTVNEEGIKFNGGSGNLLSSILMQKLKLPTSVSSSGKTDWPVTDDWYGSGTYTITPLASFAIASKTYQDCLKVEFPSTKLCFTNQKGHGFYVLARGIGIIHYEAVLDEAGSIGAIGQSIIYDALSDSSIASRQLRMRVVNASSTPQSGAFIDFNYGNGPQITAGADGVIQVPIFLPQLDSIGSLSLYLTTSDGRGEYPVTVSTPKSPTGDIDLGDVVCALPIFSTATVTLSPANGATNVSASTKKLVVTFSEDMATGYSLSSVSGGEYPTTTGNPVWTDKRTFELPVSLVSGKTYKLALNTPAYPSFKDATGKILKPVVWTFTTVP